MLQRALAYWSAAWPPWPFLTDPAEGSDGERRRLLRHPRSLEVTCRPLMAAQGSTTWPGLIWDLSAGGIGLLLGQRLKSGTLLAVEVPPALSLVPRTLLVRVARITPQPGGWWLIGCVFTPELSDDQLQTLLWPAAWRH